MLASSCNYCGKLCRDLNLDLVVSIDKLLLIQISNCVNPIFLFSPWPFF